MGSMNAKQNETRATEAGRWGAVVERDETFTGAFVYAVTTTGIYCRPGCSSRKPKRENVRFYDDWAAAEAAGFRACKRCNPKAPAATQPGREAVLLACRLIDEAEDPPSLDELAAAAGYSPYHFHRLFKAITGVTPKAYA